MKKLLILLLSFSSATAFAAIRLPNIISDNMVLQQNSNAKLWGWAEPGEKIYITNTWNNRIDSATGNEQAKWEVTIPTPKAGGPYAIRLKGSNMITLKNVMIGEVWICSGQSNMEMNYYWGMPQMNEDFGNAKNAKIRLFHIPRNSAATPQERGEGQWVEADSNTIKYFSAVAYYFGKRLNEHMDVSIGLVHASWGGTPAEVWTPAEAVNNDPVLAEANKKLNTSQWWPIAPGYTYNAMIAPLTNYNIAGAIWYQGESNVGTAATYDELLGTMIKSWRGKWNKEFPFYYVQIAAFTYGQRLEGAMLREAQTKVLQVPYTGMVVTTDLADDTSDIHPKDKRSVGYRLAQLALFKTYGADTTNPFSPLYKQMAVQKDRIVLMFDHWNGWMQKGKEIIGFEIAGEDKVFFPAQAKFSGNNISVWSKQVKQPVAVRYAFSNTAVGNVFNKQGLPLAPFRTDSW